jgi:REP element-mobilizing transposase RayT
MMVLGRCRYRCQAHIKYLKKQGNTSPKSAKGYARSSPPQPPQGRPYRVAHTGSNSPPITPKSRARQESAPMPRHLRYQPEPWMTHFVTTRCAQGYALLRPSAQTNALILGCLARALELHSAEIELHHYVFMSNHFHLLISSATAHARSKFMCHLNSNIARELCRVWGRRAQVWEARYASDVVLDEASLITALKYIFKNSVKERLVEHPRDWPGAHGWAPLCGGEVVFGEWVDRTALFFARQTQRGRHLTERDFTRRIEVRLCVPRLWRMGGDEMSVHVYLARCSEWAEEAVDEVMRAFAEEVESQWDARARSGLFVRGEFEGAGVPEPVRFLGADAVRAQPVFDPRPRPHSSPRPLCRARCPQRFAAFVSAYREFKRLFRHASARLRGGLLCDGRAPQVEFPLGGVPIFL